MPSKGPLDENGCILFSSDHGLEDAVLLFNFFLEALVLIVDCPLLHLGFVFLSQLLVLPDELLYQQLVTESSGLKPPDQALYFDNFSQINLLWGLDDNDLVEILLWT